MPSPFPGMDPFLEATSEFGCLHDGMIVYILESMQSRLPEGYFAKIGQRIWIDTSQRLVEPDVRVERSGRKIGKGVIASAAVASLAKPIVVTVPHDESIEKYVNVYKKKRDKKRLVCSIEILSLTNKTPGKKGRKLYRRKQHEILERKIHLVEIDLLRAGQHTTAVALDWAKDKTGDFDYHVCVRRFNRFEKFDVYPILLAQCLPTIAIPLLPADGDIDLDLQAIFQRAYDAGPYRRALDYRNEKVEPPLTTEQEEWMRGVLREAGIPRKSRAKA
jgi:hypothetical protein